LIQDSDAESDEHVELKVCQNGNLKTKFTISINTEEDEVIEVKWKILRKLGQVNETEKQVNVCHPAFMKLRLFVLKGGVELMNNDLMGNIDGEKYLFYSFGDDFDSLVRMEFIQKKSKLGEGGFGSVYLAHDSTIN